jgi:hypothetical protein
MEERKILGYSRTGDPIYPPEENQITIKAFILCDRCQAVISPVMGPRYGSLCVRCYRYSLDSENLES